MSEWEPRLTQTRARLERLRTEQRSLAKHAAEQAALRETIASLEQFAAQIKSGLEHADFHTRREILRTLIQRIQIEPHQVRITYRIRLPPFASNERLLYFRCRHVRSVLERNSGRRERLRTTQVVGGQWGSGDGDCPGRGDFLSARVEWAVRNRASAQVRKLTCA
jgi:predicted glycoside hydrolase/deacetylase ChbG (UPF0249 family)